MLGEDTIVAVLAEDGTAEALLRQRLEATGGGPELPELGEDPSSPPASRPRYSAPGWTGMSCSARSRAAPGRALRGADVRLKLDEDAVRATRARGLRRAGRRRTAAPGAGPARASRRRGHRQRVREPEPDHGLPRPPGAGAVPGLALRAPRRTARSPRGTEVRGRGAAAVLRAVVQRAATRPRRSDRVRRALHPARPGRDARAAGPDRAGPPGDPRRPARARLDRVDGPAAGRSRRAADARRVRPAGRGRRPPARRAPAPSSCTRSAGSSEGRRPGRTASSTGWSATRSSSRPPPSWRARSPRCGPRRHRRRPRASGWTSMRS